MTTSWLVERVQGTAAHLHGLGLPASSARRMVRVCEPLGPALVLGITQPDSDVDQQAVMTEGCEVVRRRSGGGAVLLVPGEVLWVDVVVPADDPLWQPDVARSFWWLGDAWVAALASLGLPAQAHRGPLVRTAWSDRVCFAGLGPGEVRVAGHKVVGLSQRRARAGSLIQCAVLLAWDPSALLRLMALPDGERRSGAALLAGIAAGCHRTASDLEAAFLAQLD